MSRRQPIPLPRAVLAIGVAGAAFVAVVGSPSTGISPSLDARAAEARQLDSGAAAQPGQSAQALGGESAQTSGDPTGEEATRAQAETPTPTGTPLPDPTPKPTATPEPVSVKEARIRAKARDLAASLAEDVSGFSRADVRRGIPVKFSLGTGRAVVRLQVKTGKRWANVARLELPRGKSKRTLEPGKEGRKRLAAATVEGDRVQARYAVALSDGSIDATAWKSFRLNR